MATPISASFSPDAVSEVIALTGGDPQRMAQLGVSRPEFKPAVAVLHLIKKQGGAPPMPTKSIADQAMNPPPPQNPGATGLGAINVPKGPPMGQMPGQPPGQPPMQMAAAAPPMPQMAGGGLLALDNSAFDEQSFSGGGIVAFAGGGDSKAERRKALMRIIRTAETSDQRMAARMELNAMDGMDPGRTPGRGLADALEYTRDDLPFRQPVSADASIYSPDGARAPLNVGDEPINAGPRARVPQNADASIYSPGGGTAGNKEPLITGSSLASMFEPPTRTAEQAAAAKAMYESRKEKPIPAPAWYGAAKKSPLSQEQQMNVLKDMKYHPMVGLEDVDPEGKQSGLSAFIEAGGKNYGSLLANAGIATTKGVGYAANAAGNAGAGAYDFAFTPRGKRPSSNYKPNLGSVNMGGYDPNRSSPDAQLNALLGKPAPDAGIGALLASQSARADTARGSGGARGGSGGTRTGGGPTRNNPLQQNNVVAAEVPELTNAQNQEAYKLASKLPAPPGTSAEDRDARRQEDLWSMLAQIGFGTAAGTSQFGLENLGKGASAAMPAMQEAMKNRRADDREDRKLEFESLLSQRKERGEGFDSSMREFGRLDDKRQALTIAKLADATNNRQIASSAANARLMANKQTDQGQLLEMMQSGDPKQVAAATEYQKNRNMLGDRSRIQVASIRENVVAKVDADFSKRITAAQRMYTAEPSEANKLTVQKLVKDRQDRINNNLRTVLANLPPEYLEAGDGATPAPNTLSLSDMKN